MRRLVLALALSLIVAAPAAHAQTPADLAQTAAYAASFQNPDGGFAAEPGGKSSLASTSSAIRILHYVAGSVRDVPACAAFVVKCFDKESGGFAPTPGGQPDVRTTAVGLMAVNELRLPIDKYADAATGYFARVAKGFEEIRIAVAGLEAIGRKVPEFAEWTRLVNADRNGDGTWGRGAARARATGSAAVALLRMRVDLDKRDAVLAALREGQRPDGGWSKDEGPADLESCYRVMRCFFMLKEQPDIDGIRKFIARCRHSDGGYGVAPGQPATLAATYYATIIVRWTRLLTGEPPVVETAGFVPLFNGRDLAGWEGDTSLWSARDGVLVGKSPGLKHNEFLATEKSYRDFVLKLTFRLHGDEKSNSGVQFRSVRIPGHEMSGYQADVGAGYWGCLYDESRRNKVLAKPPESALAGLNKGGWNTYVVRAMGGRITLQLNGKQTVDYREADPAIARDGRIAVQIHRGGPMEIEFQDILIQPLPTPKADESPSPGFHLRTVQGPDGERKYTVFLPDAYDGRKAFPVVLFLHGSGERGSDGVTSAQVGLGPAIACRPDEFPVIAVFPQAKQSWSADSDDARAALAALDDVLTTYKADRDRVVLTGLSMGGQGSWQLAAAHPERFSAVVPVCGSDKPDVVARVKGLPVRTFLGDADSERTVLGMRALVAELRAADASPRATEYRGVGHNSWDRAYSDPELLAWMLAQKRQGGK